MELAREEGYGQRMRRLDPDARNCFTFQRRLSIGTPFGLRGITNVDWQFILNLQARISWLDKKKGPAPLYGSKQSKVFRTLGII